MKTSMVRHRGRTASGNGAVGSWATPWWLAVDMALMCAGEVRVGGEVGGRVVVMAAKSTG